MLSGASRICCVGLVVMAPALRKADNAKGYHFPLTEALDTKLSIDLINAEEQFGYCSEFLDFINLYSISQYHSSHCETPVGKNISYKFWISTTIVSPEHLGVKCNIDRHQRQPCARDGVDESDISHHTMNRDITPVQDGMGLLNTNTSLDCDFKAHCNIGHQSAFTTVEQELLVMSPKELEDPSEFSIFEVTSDNMDQPLTPPASRPGSVPVIAASSKALPSSSISALNNLDLHNTLRVKAENLMRRLRKVQTHHAELHVVQQLKHFVSHQQRNLRISCQRPQHSVPNRKTKDSVNLKTEFFHSEDVKNLSTAALVKLVRRLESSHVSTKLPHTQKGMWVDKEGSLADGNMTKFSSSECMETKRVTGTLMTNLHHVESCIDSDATESSSGGESCDEYDMQANKKGSTISIRRRAEWKWAIDRASVAARWTWLQAQISDLEYSIRQQNDIHCQLQLSKQPLKFDCPIHSEITDSFNSVGCVSSCSTHPVDHNNEATLCLSGSSKEIRNLSLANKHITKPVNGLLDSGTNGYHPVRGVLNNSNSGQCVDRNIKQLSSGSSHIVCCSSRTRPLSSFKKRKLFRTIGLHLSNKKAAQLSTVKCNCNCQCKMLPCALCGGRYNSIQTVDQDIMPVIERISLLDPSFHPVVSFEHEISYDLVVQKLLKYTEISKSLSQWGLHLKKKLHMSVPTKGITNHSRKNTCRLARNAAQTLLCTAKLRKNFGGKKPGPKKKLIRTGKRKYVRKKQSDFGLSLVKKRPYRRRTLSVASSGSSKPDSPVPSPSYWTTDGLGSNSFNSTSRPSILQDMLRRRRGENTFDINNIVIPYSVASSTRVEKIKYKEIVTPKWRLVENALPLDIKENSMPDENEDITDEAYSERHELCEKEEKKKFSTIYTHANPHGRVRSRSRGDIHADSSDGNTPDALSPHQFDILGQDSNSSLNITDCLPTHASAISLFLEDSLSSIVTANPNTERRRTASFTKKDWPDESRTDVEEVEEVAPYEPYVFPLSDEVWEKMQENSPHLRVDSSLLPSREISHSFSNSPISPASSSNSSIIDDDPCDPEWTVVSERGSHQSLVLKFAKR